MLYVKTLKLHHLRYLGHRLASRHWDVSKSAEIQAYGSLEATREVVEDNFIATKKFIDSLQTSEQFEQIRNFNLNFWTNKPNVSANVNPKAGYGNATAICIYMTSAGFRTRLYCLTALNLIRNSATLTSLTMLRSW